MTGVIEYVILGFALLLFLGVLGTLALIALVRFFRPAVAPTKTAVNAAPAPTYEPRPMGFTEMFMRLGQAESDAILAQKLGNQKAKEVARSMNDAMSDGEAKAAPNS